MSWTIPLPGRTRRLASHNTHPGLLLDKFTPSWNEGPGNEKFSEHVQRKIVDDVAQLSTSKPSDLDYARLFARHQQARPFAPSFRATTVGPLTLHLARASALENAGICLHPIYGFAYLPGSGLKGMAHAYACEVWLPTQADRDREKAWNQICEVFGMAPSPWLKKLAERLGVTCPKKARAGAVVFHDAWPTSWPRLIVDIVNCHHPDYYQPPDDRREYPPGDWENPVPVNFLAVPAGVTFEFAVSQRRDVLSDERVEFPAQWLVGALKHLGAGAKTNAGYGAFSIDLPLADQAAGDVNVQALKAAVEKTWQAATEQRKPLAEFTCTLELVTPAFLAGAHHEGDDGRRGCDLRAATLRGQLRWWWRTLHAGHLDTATLRRLEAAVWGDTKSGGAVRIALIPVSTPNASERIELFNKRSHETVARDEKTGDYGTPNLAVPDPNKITPGVAYLAFGMDDMVNDPDGTRRRRQRVCLSPGRCWTVKLTARETEKVPAEIVLEQTKAALWLLSTYGGVGSKARKGFGSLACDKLAGYTAPMCDAAAAQCRRAFRDTSKPAAAASAISAFNNRVADVTVDFANCSDVWAVIEQVGFAVQAFAKWHAHERPKRALGLPRKIKPPERGQFNPTGPFKAIYEDADPHGRPPKPWEKARFAAPWHVHIARLGSGYRVRVTAFVQSSLPNSDDSRRLLGELLDHLKVDLPRRARLAPKTAPIRSTTSPSGGCESTSSAPSPPPRANYVADLPQRTVEELKARLGQLRLPSVLLKVLNSASEGGYACQCLRLAPKVAAGYQSDGGWKLKGAPQGLPADTIVLAEATAKTALFREVFGKLPSRRQSEGGKALPRRR